MKRYPAYKASGIEWLGKIPKHWELQRLEYLADISFSNIDKKTYESEIEVFLCNYIDVYKNDFITQNMGFMKGTATEAEIDKFTLRRGDMLLTKDSETPDDIAKPAFVKEALSGVVCGYHLAVIRPNERGIKGEYLFRIFNSKSLNTHFFIFAKGITRFGLSTQSFKDFVVPIPPLPEQQTIVDYLNQETAKIDKIITNTEQQIEHLQQYRTSLISDAVTGKVDVRNEVIPENPVQQHEGDL
jgi:type I restriction enzyme S subunit